MPIEVKHSHLDFIKYYAFKEVDWNIFHLFVIGSKHNLDGFWDWMHTQSWEGTYNVTSNNEWEDNYYDLYDMILQIEFQSEYDAVLFKLTWG